eukprot:13123593-Ditylum_brightwellii.AAC.1
MDMLPVSSAQRAARLLSMCLVEFKDNGACRWILVRLLVSETSRPFPSAALTASPTTSRVSVFLCGRAKMVKFMGMSGVFQVKCPMCIAVDAPGAIPQMQLRCHSWSWRCSSAFAVVAWSKKI